MMRETLKTPTSRSEVIWKGVRNQEKSIICERAGSRIYLEINSATSLVEIIIAQDPNRILIGSCLRMLKIPIQEPTRSFAGSCRSLHVPDTM